jgi:PEP-CTERM motif
MRRLLIGARLSAHQGFAGVSIQSFAARLVLGITAFFAASVAHADLTFDLRAVSGSQIIIHGPKSVAVNHNSVGGWIDFELYAFVNGANTTANDESMHSFAGNMLSTHIGRGAAGGSMVNSGEIAPRVQRGIVPPLDHYAHSHGTVQNLDDDPDLEVGGPGWALNQYGDRYTSTMGMLIGRGDPFRVRNYEGENAVAEFLLYRFTLPIESIPAENLSDMTSIYFSPGPLPPSGLWFEDGLSQSTLARDPVQYGQSVLIHTADTPEELAMIPEPGTWLLGASAFLGLALALRRRRLRLIPMNRPVAVALILLSLSLTAATAEADLTFDLRAVSGSQIIIHGPKSVALNQNSVGGWIDFELWGSISGANSVANDEALQLFAGSMLSTHLGKGAVAGSMVNSGEIVPRVLRGVVAPFDGTGHHDGALNNLDDDPDLEIGSLTLQETFKNIGGRSGSSMAPYSGDAQVAEFLLYRFTLPIEGLRADVLGDMTTVSFLQYSAPTAFLWSEDGAPKNGVVGTVITAEPVFVHTAQNPEELALIPEPGTWALGFMGMLGAGWFARRRRNK